MESRTGRACADEPRSGFGRQYTAVDARSGAARQLRAELVRPGPLHGHMILRIVGLLVLIFPVALAADCGSPPPDRETARARFEERERAAQEAFQRRDFTTAAENLRQAICF